MRTSTQQPALLRITEAATVLGISRTKLYELIQRGEIGVVRIDRSVRLPRVEVDRWIGEQLDRHGITVDGGSHAG